MSTTNLPGSWWRGLRVRRSYGPFPRELIHVALRKTEVRPKIFSIGNKPRRRRRRLRIAARKTESRAHDADRTVDPGHGFECLEQPALDDLRMFEHRRHIEDLPRGNSILVEEHRPFPRRPRRQRAFDLGVQFETTPLAILASGEAPMGDQLFAIDQPAQRLELFLLVGRNIQETFAGPERARGTS